MNKRRAVITVIFVAVLPPRRRSFHTTKGLWAEKNVSLASFFLKSFLPEVCAVRITVIKKNFSHN